MTPELATSSRARRGAGAASMTRAAAPIGSPAPARHVKTDATSIRPPSKALAPPRALGCCSPPRRLADAAWVTGELPELVTGRTIVKPLRPCASVGGGADARRDLPRK